MSEIISLLIVALLSLFIIMKSASYLIRAISSYARKTGISDYLIGFLIVSLGTSLPELSTAIMASWANKGQLIAGNAIGASIVDITLVLGIVAIVGKKVKVEGKAMTKTFFIMVMIGALPILLGLDSIISRIDGVILLIAFSFYIFVLLRKEKKHGHVKKDVQWKHIWKDMAIFLGTLIALLLSARWLVFSSIRLSYMLDIPIYLMGVIFISLATTTPELTVSIHSLLKNSSGLAFGNIYGSVMANISLIVGIAAIINPIPLTRIMFLTSAIFLLCCLMLGTYIIRQKNLNWKQGIVLVSLYILFVFIQVTI